MPLSGAVRFDKSKGNGKYGKLIREKELDSQDIFLSCFGEMVRVVAVLVDGRPAIKRVLVGNGQDYCLKVGSG